jgi:PleD family two-component response regulator
MDDFLRNCGRPILEKPFTKAGCAACSPRWPAEGKSMSEAAHIVVVDDDEDVRETVAEYLRRNGFRSARRTAARRCAP